MGLAVGMHSCLVAALAVALASPARENSGPDDASDLDLLLVQAVPHLKDERSVAVRKLNDIVAIARKRRDRKHEWSAQRGLILAFKWDGELKRAEQLARENLAVARRHRVELDDQAPDVRGGKYTVFSRESESLGDLSSILTAEKQYEKAIAALRAQIAILDKMDASMRAAAQLAAGVAEGQREQTAAAVRAQLADLDKTARSLEKLPPELRGGALEDFAKTRAIFEEQLRTGLANLDRALAPLNAPEVSAWTPMTNQYQAVALGRLGMNQFLTGHAPQAEASLRAAIGHVRRLAKGMGALGQPPPNYLVAGDLIVNLNRRLAQVLLAEKQDQQALALLELARGRAIARELHDRSVARDDSSWDPSSAVDSGDHARRVGATVVSYSLFTQFDADLLQTSDQDLVPVVQVTIAVSTPDGQTTIRSVDLSREPLELGRLIRDGRRAMGVRGRGEPEPAGPAVTSSSWLRRLYQVLIDPIADLLPAQPDAVVTIIPQQLLFLVPFAALEDANGRALIELHTLGFQASLRVAELSRASALQRSTESPGGAVVVGNPTMPVVSNRGRPLPLFPALPGAEREAVAVAEMLGARALLHDAPDRDTVLNLLPPATIIHLASHALSDDLNGLSGAVVLAARGKASPFLTAQDLLMTELTADLVVLSACNTGRGRVSADGTVGLVSSLLSAGAASVVASLWSVSDDATTFLMTELYRNLKLAVPKATALRTAMLATRTRFGSPARWAPFVLFGDAAAAPRLQRLRVDREPPQAPGVDCSSLGRRAIPLPVDRGQIRNLAEMPWRVASGRRNTFYAVNLGRQEIIDFYRDVLTPYGFHEVASAAQTTVPWSLTYFECSSGPVVYLTIAGGAPPTDAQVGVQWLDSVPPRPGPRP